MIVVRNRRGGAGSRRASTVSDADRSSGPNLASRFRSNSTSSLPLAGRCAYSEVMIARVLTVKSMTDWKVRIGGSPASRPSRARRAICCCSACVRSQDWRAPLTGNELYLNGLNSGRMPSQAAFANAGKIAGRPATPAKRANAVMPIIGEISTMRSGGVSCGSSSASSAYFIASAPPLENPTRCSGSDGPMRRRASRTASRVAAIQSSHSTSVRAAGTVPCAGSLIATAT